MKFRTELKNYDSGLEVKYGDKVMCIGSCFVEHLHTFLQEMKFQSFLNPCGITYNPISIANAIYYMLGRTEFRSNDLVRYGGIYSHYDFHSDVSAITKEEAEKLAAERMKSAQQFSPPDVLILSLGTAFVYFRNDNGDAVNNCHKIPPSQFTKRMLEVEEVTHVLQAAIDELRTLNPAMKVVVTVSPVRHLRDGIIENNLSKSTLLLATSKLTGASYFPSYELLLDDLRDYRFYDDDLTHPAQQAVKYILEFFEEKCFSRDETGLRKQVRAIRKDLSHRPFFPKSQAHQDFIQKLLARMKTLQDSSVVDFSTEIAKMKNS